MTVLGKIAVPKPVNLPSQKSENHGLDPNVEIVPKGTISWGPAHRSSTSANSWGSSGVSSPNAEVTASALGRPSSGGSHLTGRPSSGGSGTRPSTAGSEKSCEPAHSAWSSSSRPSSASGVLAGNNTIAAARPRSADTRPGSSQLSRFADSSAEGSVAWRGPGTSERLGIGASKTSGFTLSSGDFPTLGSEKVSELHGQHGNNSHGRPSSASDRPSSQKGSPSEESMDAAADKGIVNTWKRDHSPYRGGESAPEKWQREPQHTTPYANMHMPPQHFDAWYAGPIPNQPEGGWFRGATPVGPYAPMGGPGGYPLDPSTYYHPQMAVRSVPYPPTMARPGAAGPGYSKNGEVHRPLIPDPYMMPGHPLIPVRPGMYPGPVPGYYGPSPGFCKSDETDASVMEAGVAPSTHDARYPGQSTQPDPGSANARFLAPSGPNVMMTSREHGGRAQETQGPYKVLLKQRDEVVGKDAEDKKNHHLKLSSQHSGRPTSQSSSVCESDWDSVASINEPMDFSKPAFADDSFGISKDNAVVTHSHEGTKHVASDKFVAEKSSSHDQPFPVSTTNVTSVGKTDYINVKSGTSDGHSDVQSSFSKEDNSGKPKVATAKRDHPSRDVSANVTSSKGLAVSHDKTIEVSSWVKRSDLPGSLPIDQKPSKIESSTSEVLDSSENSERAHFQSYKRNHGANGRGDHRAKGKFHIQEGEGWRRKALELKTPGTRMESNTATSEILKDDRVSQGVSEKPSSTVTKVGEPPSNVKAGGELYITSSNDSIDYKAQRARMKEIAVQRAKQRQEEEEERIREQKAKALAKLEELNRRTASECSTQNADETSKESNITKHKIVEQSSNHVSVKADVKATVKVQDCQGGKLEESPVVCDVLNTKQEGQISADHANRLDSTVHASKDVGFDTVTSVSQGPQAICASSVVTATEIGSNELPLNRDAMQSEENGIFRQRPVSAKRRPHLPHDISTSSQPSVNGSTSDVRVTVVADEGASCNLPNVIGNNIEHITSHKRKGSKALKNKHKLDEASMAGLATSGVVDISASNATSETIKPELSQAPQEVSSMPSITAKNITEDLEPKNMPISVTSENQGFLHASDEPHARTNNWRNQTTRRPSRSSQMVRQGERLHGSEAVWAPVRPTSQNLLSEDANQQNIGNNEGESATKHVHVNTQSAFKSKRAEMERYVPKPVVKELSQQGILQQPSGSASPQTASSQQALRIESAHDSERGHQNDANAAKTGSGIEMRTGEGRHKHGKTHTSWRQRGAVESYCPSASSGEHVTSDQSKNSSKAADVQNLCKPQASSSTELVQHSGGGSVDASVLNNLGSGSGSSHDPDVLIPQGESSSNISRDGKKKPQTRLQSGADNNEKSEDKVVQNTSSEKIDKQSLAFKSTEIEGRGGSRADPHSVPEHRTSQWQPKTHFSHKGNRAGGRGIGSQKFTAQAAPSHGKEVPSQGIGYFSQHVDKYHGSHAKSQYIEKDYISQTKPNQARLPTDIHHQASDKEIKGPVLHDHVSTGGQGRQQTTRQLMPDQSTIASEATWEQPVRAGNRRHGQHSSGFHNRALEETRDGNWSQGQDSSMQQHQVPPHSEKRKPPEYQRGDSHRHGSSFQHNSTEVEDTRDTGSQAPVVSKYRERGHNQGRRGGRFYGRAPNHVAKVAAVGDGE
ncbi:MODIFIER OF SNC1 1 protein [Nymphaea thermarum]|nr:MODIFIER OF SNC1 1 protein [Nymphaea thermarum]